MRIILIALAGCLGSAVLMQHLCSAPEALHKTGNVAQVAAMLHVFRRLDAALPRCVLFNSSLMRFLFEMQYLGCALEGVVV